jgi:hypothetical protein
LYLPGDEPWVLDPTVHVTYELPGAEITSLEAFWVVIGEVINGPGGYFGWNLQPSVTA